MIFKFYENNSYCILNINTQQMINKKECTVIHCNIERKKVNEKPFSLIQPVSHYHPFKKIQQI